MSFRIRKLDQTHFLASDVVVRGEVLVKYKNTLAKGRTLQTTRRIYLGHPLLKTMGDKGMRNMNDAVATDR